MAKRLIVKAGLIQARLAIPLIAIPLFVYLLTWNWNPYAYGFSVMGLAPIQLLWSVAGVFFVVSGISSGSKGWALLVNAILAGSAVGAFVLLKSINWA